MNQADQAEVKRLIAENRKGFPLWAKESLAFAIVMGGAVFVITSYIPAQIGSQTSGMSGDVGVLKSEMVDVKKDLGDIKLDIKNTLSDALKRAYPVAVSPSTGPQKRTALELGNTVIEMANKLGIQLEESVPYGKNALHLATTDPTIHDIAWRATNLAMGQKALINANFVPNLSRPPESKFQFWVRYDFPGPVSYTGTWIQLGRVMSGTEGAVSDKLDEIFNDDKPHVQLHVPNDLASEYVLLPSARVAIDGYHLKNIIYKNSHITYRGGRILLENVYFVNCTFEILDTAEGERFSEAVFGSASVSFRSGV